MARQTTSAVLVGKREIVLQSFPLPKIGERDALLKVEMCGICGSDWKAYNGYFNIPYPIILGHEFVGWVEQAGNQFLERHKLKMGDRVICEFTIGCGECYYCKIGEYKFCEKNLNYGHSVSSDAPPHLWGGYGEFVYLPYHTSVHKISERLPAEAAVLVCAAVGNAIRWVKTLGKVSMSDVVVILGPGCQGLSAVIVAKECGAHPIIMVGTSDDARRFDLAREYGADHIVDVKREDVAERVKEISDGQMADIVLDVAGYPEATASTIELVKKKGTIVIGSMSGQNTPMHIDQLVYKEIVLVGAYSHDIRSVKPAIKLVESRRYPVEKMVTHVMNLRDVEEAMKISGRKQEGEDAIKVALVCA
jgi:2-desacetyl-2-hydroxyethyl bacteriochlorophyllide A dehydrogenase